MKLATTERISAIAKTLQWWKGVASLRNTKAKARRNTQIPAKAIVRSTAVKSCFVISPIGPEGSKTREHADELFKHILTPVLGDLGYGLERADQMQDLGMITQHIMAKVVSSDLVIAILTEKNPNVFYELAIRHATQRPCIQLIRHDEALPFDIQDLRTLFYNISSPGQTERLKEELRGAIESAHRAPNEARTPLSTVIATGLLVTGGVVRHDFSQDIVARLDRVDSKLESVINGQQQNVPGRTNADNLSHFYARTGSHHRFVHAARDLCVKLLAPCDRFFVGNSVSDPPKSLQPLIRFRSDIVSMLEHMVRMFELTVPAGVRIWASLRDRRADNQYHTLARAGRFQPIRSETSQPLDNNDSVTVKRLKSSFSSGQCVVITGSSCGPEMWEEMKNGKFQEDKSVLMAAVLAKSWDERSAQDDNFVNRKLMLILCICSDREGTFTESHVPLMQCCNDTMSTVVNVMLRSRFCDAGPETESAQKITVESAAGTII